MGQDEVIITLDAVAGAIVNAEKLFAKDADLDRNDLLGDIDLGAAREMVRHATLWAKDLENCRIDSAMVPAGRYQALRQVGRVLVENDGTIDEAFVPTLGKLVLAAYAIPEGACPGPEVDDFSAALKGVTEALGRDH